MSDPGWNDEPAGAPRRDLVDELLNDRRYHIEFNGHLTNHVKHAVIALAGLGAPPARIEGYYENYARLTPYGHALEAPKPSRQVISAATWERFIGKRTSFWGYCEYFEQRVAALGLDEVLRRDLPVLLPGWVGAFTHATIHLGWALDVNHPWMTIEGLAYMAFSYVSCHPERGAPARVPGRAGERAVDSLLRIAATWERDRDVLQPWLEGLVADTAAAMAAGVHPELMRSGLQYRIATLAMAGHPMIYETPAWIDDQAVSVSWDQLYYAVTLLYVALPGDFVLLHLITSLYAMEQIADRLPPAQQKRAVACFWIGMLCIVFSRTEPPPAARLAALHAEYRDRSDDLAQPAVVRDWAGIVERAIAEDEEHNPKMVYVLQKLWKRTGGLAVFRAAASRFTTTPELPRSFEEPPAE